MLGEPRPYRGHRGPLRMEQVQGLVDPDPADEPGRPRLEFKGHNPLMIPRSPPTSLQLTKTDDEPIFYTPVRSEADFATLVLWNGDGVPRQSPSG